MSADPSAFITWSIANRSEVIVGLVGIVLFLLFLELKSIELASIAFSVVLPGPDPIVTSPLK